MSQAIRAYVEAQGGKVTAEAVTRHINTEYPGRWRPGTLTAHLYACAVNNPKAYIHHASTPKFLYRYSDGSMELYSEELHGPNEWEPESEGDGEGDELTLAPSAVQYFETSISLERDIEDHLIHHLDALEPGLKFIGRQVTTDVGRIDILAEDASGERVVIEVKVGDAKDAAVGQIARYLGWYAKTDGKPPRGILVARHFPEGTRYAASAISNLTLIAYQVQFSFESVSLNP
ncbi:endonuclease NucS domain-containing protein [Armatimonas rosea]|uniref:DUF91 domain-containing protein n=1 Tax=Armatimonas rosea TaxID=685828 RepID=A0A7W9W6C1_ARMRO|nr:endonuclease NucS domain-containing protein [Armatimonas rosea]MBB6050433.1 hypothetical protein [Armatimonas rosea]